MGTILPKVQTGFLSTPSARRATFVLVALCHFVDISIHALREEGDLSAPIKFQLLSVFLSTPSARRATLQAVLVHNVKDISIHALREEGDFWDRAEYLRRRISIHALREEGDGFHSCAGLLFGISIHALREEGDAVLAGGYLYGGRFLSTPSARRATRPRKPSRLKERGISIHALREEGDRYNNRMPRRAGDFYPRPPRGGRRVLARTTS